MALKATKNSKKSTVQQGDVKTEITGMSVKTPPSGMCTVGFGKGITLNMGDYQSARLDLFIIRNVPDNEESIVEAVREIADRIDEELTKEVVRLNED